MSPPLIYVAGPYRANNAWDVEQNIRRAESLAFTLALAGAYPITPHANTRGYFECAQSDPLFWLGGTLELMRRCDAIALLDTWGNSSGAMAEHEEARRLALPILYPTDNLNGEVAAFVRHMRDRAKAANR